MRSTILMVLLLLCLQSFSQDEWSSREAGTRIEKINLGNTINSVYNDFAPVISSDGKCIYFVRSNIPTLLKNGVLKTRIFIIQQKKAKAVGAFRKILAIRLIISRVIL